MLSGPYPFSQIIEDVKQETGITNLRNHYAQIRQLIAKAEYEINPYAGFLIRKRMIYFKGNGNFDGVKIKKPLDYVSIDKVGCCQDGICDGKFIDTVSHIVLCDNVVRTQIAFTYWGLQHDGDGNPVTTYNHSEAVVAYIVWKMYAPKIFLGEGSSQQFREYQRFFEDRCMEARGEDFFPSEHTLAKIRQQAIRSSAQMDKMFLEDYCSSCDCLTTINDGEFMKNKVWYWQMNNINSKITSGEEVTDEFLLNKSEITLAEAMSGYTFVYPYVGQIGFCIDNVDVDSIDVVDLFNLTMNNTLFSFYQVSKRRLIFVSKDYKTQSSIFLKFNYNG